MLLLAAISVSHYLPLQDSCTSLTSSGEMWPTLLSFSAFLLFRKMQLGVLLVAFWGLSSAAARERLFKIKPRLSGWNEQNVYNHTLLLHTSSGGHQLRIVSTTFRMWLGKLSRTSTWSDNCPPCASQPRWHWLAQNGLNIILWEW